MIADSFVKKREREMTNKKIQINDDLRTFFNIFVFRQSQMMKVKQKLHCLGIDGKIRAGYLCLHRKKNEK